MKTRVNHPAGTPVRGFTLLEMTIVIMILLALVGMTTMGSKTIGEWRKGRDASEVLRSVYVAQRTYLADHPTTSMSTVSKTDLLPYLPTKATVFPTVKGLDGVTRQIKVTVSPPVVIDTTGAVYDPSENPNDSLWDVGE